MASVSDVTLQFGAASADPRLVRVKGKLHFDAGDVGKSFNLDVDLYGAEPAGDTLPPGDHPRSDFLYSFKWASATSKTIPVAAAGIVAFDESRNVPASVLDEDAGETGPRDINVPNEPLPGLPHKDEVFALVTLVTRASARSRTVVANTAGV